MKRQPCGTIRVFKSGRAFYRTIEELEAGYEVNGGSTEEHEKAV